MRALSTLAMLGASVASALLAAPAAHGSPIDRVSDTGTAGTGAASLTGPIIVPIEANRLGEGAAQGAAQNAAQHVNANVCDVAADVGVLGSPTAPIGGKTTECDAARLGASVLGLR
ncbi:hypothetical protein GCM10010178_18370 [Lentzea flava]|uniref:Small secreted domain n=1 Tax=Lentzea flava TaxID=103732 RepID=A0ABQ2UEH0_9PSEU|nr:hypothetical protein GCM10010178_18370 [Lentzea flava]